MIGMQGYRNKWYGETFRKYLPWIQASVELMSVKPRNSYYIRIWICVYVGVNIANVDCKDQEHAHKKQKQNSMRINSNEYFRSAKFNPWCSPYIQDGS